MHKVLRGVVFSVASLGMGVAAAAPAAVESELLDRYLAQAAGEHEPGVALIATVNGKTVYRGARGVARVDAGRSLAETDTFRIGGLSNQFTATAVLLLVEQGKLALSDPVRKFLPALDERAAGVTLEHLLAHTSGLVDTGVDAPGTDASAKPEKRKPPQGAPPSWIKSLAPLSPPGARFQYTGAGYALLARVIERVSGKSYARFLADNLFKPFGLKDTSVEAPGQISKLPVSGHVRDGAGFAVNAPEPAPAQSPPQVVSTVGDLAKWYDALSNVRVLKAKTMERLFAAQKLGNGQSTRYGLGWGLEAFNGQAALQHSGSDRGFSAFMMGVPEAGVFVVALSNNAGRLRAPMVLAQRVAAALMGEPFPDWRPAALTADELDRHTGIYRMPDGSDRLVYRDGDRLCFQRPGGVRQEMSAATAHEFFDNDTLTYLRFEPDLRGVTAAVEVRQAIGTQKAARTSAVPPPIKAVQPLSGAQFAPYAGRYRLTPLATLDVFEADGRFYMQPSREERVEIFPEREDLFFIKTFEASLEFVRDAREQVYEVVLRLPGGEMRAPRVQ